MRNSPGWLIFAGLMLLLDFYVFQIIRVVSQSAGSKTRTVIFITFWVISLLAVVILFVLPYLNLHNYTKGVRSTVFALVIGLFLTKLIASVFFLIDDIRRLIQWAAGRLFFNNTEGEQIQSGGKISRSVFLSWMGLAVGGGLYTSLIFGFFNKYKYRIRRHQLSFPNLPVSFKGLKIVQISDIHCGSFTDKSAVSRGVEKIMSLRPDLILFTGDLVNNRSDEMDDYVDVFNRLKAPLGIYSILGNHDYGDYTSWPDSHAKKQNLEKLKNIHGEMGWRLMMDENISLERNGEKIGLIGIQNWSALRRFPRYGDLSKAYAGSDNSTFKILMSHDPTHWDAEIRPLFGDIDLTLSGHTHGMQFGWRSPDSAGVLFNMFIINGPGCMKKEIKNYM